MSQLSEIEKQKMSEEITEATSAAQVVSNEDSFLTRKVVNRRGFFGWAGKTAAALGLGVLLPGSLSKTQPAEASAAIGAAIEPGKRTIIMEGNLAPISSKLADKNLEQIIAELEENEERSGKDLATPESVLEGIQMRFKKEDGTESEYANAWTDKFMQAMREVNHPITTETIIGLSDLAAAGKVKFLVNQGLQYSDAEKDLVSPFALPSSLVYYDKTAEYQVAFDETAVRKYNTPSNGYMAVLSLRYAYNRIKLLEEFAATYTPGTPWTEDIRLEMIDKAQKSAKKEILQKEILHKKTPTGNNIFVDDISPQAK